MTEWLVDLLAGTVLPRAARIGVLIAIGVLLANLAVSFGLVDRVAALSRYLTEPANLPAEVGTAILAGRLLLFGVTVPPLPSNWPPTC